MPTAKLEASIHPTHLQLTSGRLITISWGDKDLGFPLTMNAQVVTAKAIVTCELPRYDQTVLSTLLARANDLVRGFTDTAGFASGIGWQVVWETFQVDDGEVLKIQKINPVFASLCTSFKFPPTNVEEQEGFEAVLRLVLREPNLLGSMADLAETLAHHHVTPTNCGRVIDSLRRAVAPNEKEKAGWKMLRSILNVDESYLRYISTSSTQPRHGDRTTRFTALEVQEIANRTWNVMNRFIEYRKGGNTPLLLSEFPMLMG